MFLGLSILSRLARRVSVCSRLLQLAPSSTSSTCRVVQTNLLRRRVFNQSTTTKQASVSSSTRLLKTNTMSSGDEDYSMENYEPTPVAKKSTKRAKVVDSDADSVASKPVVKKAKAVKRKEPLDELDDNFSEAVPTPKGKKGASDMYQKLTQLEHVIKRPDTYIGSIETQQNDMWSFNPETSAMEFKKISMVPGLFKIYDEILVNAADNKQRDADMDTLKVDFDREANTISVQNNGRGIPVEMHAKEKMYIPELIFGHLLTSSNYDDDQKKTTGGRNGYGAKLANIFSKEFTLETADKKNGKKYVQTWTNNMSKMTTPKITSFKSGEYTKITFKPDLQKFGMEKMDDDLEGIFKRRVYDLAGCVPGVKVFLNGERIKVKTFKEYANMYISSLPEREKPPPLVYERVNDRWEVAFTISEGQFNQVSFVNSIATTKGGTHVNHVADQLVTKIVAEYNKKNKKAQPLKPFQVKQHMWLFVNCKIENPAFDSQTKETLTLKASQFGSKCTLSEDFMKKVMKSGILDDITRQSDLRADKAMKKTDGSKRTRITGMAKLEDANRAGTKDAERCTLILTEGDSAKTLAIAGMSVVGRDHFGVFPLRGKLLNVRDAAAAQISANVEIQNIKTILGLQHGKTYASVKDLRYGHLMIMTDQDHDGSHIKGLIINYLECYYKSLLQIPGFLVEFITPIVRCTKGKEQVSFFTLPEYEYWKEQTQPGKEWKIKYFKGLGTSDTADAKKYFSDLDKHLKEFHTLQAGDEDLISLAFSKKKADDRKEWLRLFKPGTYMDHSVAKISIADFINKELILFSMADNIRSIPNVMDGFKPGQRKILFACFKRKLKAEIKVAQLCGYVGEHTAYHHGEVSLAQTIVGLAQSFVGANNINLLMPNGQFGTRHQGGKDAASARYIFTDLARITKKAFCEADMPLLNYLNDDGLMVEPEWYAPVVPMLLVNGASGIGTGWSTDIPNFNPKDIIANLRALMDGDEVQAMRPWYRGFRGEIADGKDEGNFKSVGQITEIDDNTLEITELPVGFWTQNMKEFLEKGIAGDEKNPAWIKDYADNSTEAKVHFTVTLADKAMKDLLKTGLVDKFKLSESISMKNLVAFDPEGRIKRYASAQEILVEFYHIRLQLYQKRKDWMAADLERQHDRLSNQARFVQMIIAKELVVSGKKKAALVQELKDHKFTSFPNKKTAQVAGETEGAVEEDVESDGPDHGFDYLLGMAIWSLTKERVEKLLRDRSLKEAELNALLKLSAKDLWKSDLLEFEAEWDALLEADLVLQSSTDTIKKKARGSKLAGKGKAAAKRKAESDDDDFSPVKKVVKKAKAVSREPSVAASVKAEPKALKQTKLDLHKTSPISVLADEEEPKVKAQSKQKPAVIKKPSVVVSDDDDDCYNFVNTKAAAIPKAKAAPVKKSEAATLFEDSDDDLFSKIAATAAASKPAAVKAKPAKVASLSDSDDAMPAAKPAKVTKAKPAVQTAASRSSADDSDEAPAKKTKAVAKSKAAVQRTASLSLSDDDSDEAPAKKSKAKPKAKAHAARKPLELQYSSEESDAAPSKPAAKPKAKAPARKPAQIELSDDESDAPVAKTKGAAKEPAVRPGRARAAASKVTVSHMDSDDDEQSAFDSASEESDGDDYED